MKNIFLSRPNWISQEYQQGLDNLITILKAHDLNPRTLGITDFANVTPMEEIIDILNECEGALILGFKQFETKSRVIKNKVIPEPIYYPTEWNHIEGAIAYTLRLPLLLIHDAGVNNGIFAKGVANSFLYEKDLLDHSWALSKDISGAIEKWKSKLNPKKKLDKELDPKESPKTKWGCFTFPPDENLYCPFCYNNKGLKFLTTRLDTKRRTCTSCKGIINVS